MMRRNQCKRLLALLLAVMCVLTAAGCSLSAPVTPSDAVSRPVSSEPAVLVNALEAVEITADGVKMEDVFLLESNWYGASYQSEDSLNKLMMMKYSAENSVIPQASDGSRVNMMFAVSEGMPEELTVTQQGNTVRANTGIPYDINEVGLTDNGEGGCYFDIAFGNFTMYYYVAECRWSNGNTAKYAFALERSVE